MLVTVQVPTFHIGQSWISLSPRDGQRLATELRNLARTAAHPCVYTSAAAKIERAMQLHESTTIRLEIGEDEAVLAALTKLREAGDLHGALRRLELALQRKIDAEG